MWIKDSHNYAATKNGWMQAQVFENFIEKTFYYKSFCAKLLGNEPPGKKTSVSFNNLLCNFLDCAKLRRTNIYAEMSNCEETSQLGSVFSIVLINLEWYQMTNIWLITEIIIKNHPYLLLWGEVASLMKDYNDVLKKYADYRTNFKYLKY